MTKRPIKLKPVPKDVSATLSFNPTLDCCASCKFFQTNLPVPLAGWCRWEPPKQVAANGDSSYPPIGGDKWCGQYQRAVAKDS